MIIPRPALSNNGEQEDERRKQREVTKLAAANHYRLPEPLVEEAFEPSDGNKTAPDRYPPLLHYDM